MPRHVLAALLVAASFTANADTVRIDIRTDAPIGRINPNVYGQFVEHLGRGIYGGIWVGPDSEIPNQDGYRIDVLQALKELEVPLMRWPGGCFADQYHWRDGIGPADARVARLNASWGGVIEPNTFGTHEFFNLAEILGAQTYLNFNVATGTAREAIEWLEYITSDSASALANERRANGRDEPWKIDYYSIGNETWGCGGNMRPSFYADEYARFATFLNVPGAQPKRIVSGSYEGNIDYSREILENRGVTDRAEGISVHFYTLPTGDWGKKGAGMGFPEAEWISTIERTQRMDGIITEQLEMIDAADIDGEFQLYVDEWGMWVDPPADGPGGVLYQQNTIRDAVVAAVNLNIFHDYADRVPMTNIAQMVNVLQAMILTDGPRMLRTPTYHVFNLYKPFRNAEALPVAATPPAYRHAETSVPALSISAARHDDGRLVLAIVNVDPGTAHEIDLGDTWNVISANVLAGDAMDAHNTFEAPDKVRPVRAEVGDRARRIPAPPASVTVLELAR